MIKPRIFKEVNKQRDFRMLTEAADYIYQGNYLVLKEN